VLKDNTDKIAEKLPGDKVKWSEFHEFYETLENFEYPHKDKLLDFIKYFFLDHILDADTIILNSQAFKDSLAAKRLPVLSGEKSRNGSTLRSRRKSGDSPASHSASGDDMGKRKLLGSDPDKFHEEEKMLDIAEQCFLRIADLLHLQQKTVKSIFLKYSEPEKFKSGQVLELLSPRGFMEGIQDIGFDDITEMEAACLMKVLAKPELDNQIILNEFALIMENFGIPQIDAEDEFENDYQPTDEDDPIKTEDGEQTEAKETKEAKEGNQEEDGPKKEGEDKKEPAELDDKLKKYTESTKTGKKNVITLKFEVLSEVGLATLKKLARFLLERYMHPREFFGPTIK